MPTLAKLVESKDLNSTYNHSREKPKGPSAEACGGEGGFSQTGGT
jgi:hypothetical protein